MGKAPEKKGRHTFGTKKLKKMAYISKEEAIKKLYISEDEFRQLVILKGIYPREPQKVKKLNEKKRKGEQSINNKSLYYSAKDINFLMHERIYHQMSEFKSFEKKFKTAKQKKNNGDVLDFYKNRPFVTFDHLIKERYPTFYSALSDLDDCLTLLFLFSKMFQVSKEISQEEIRNISQLCSEFMTIVSKMDVLKKTFISIKGIYYQVVILGQKITWVVPYDFPQTIPNNVDFSIFKIYLLFYQTLMTFVNFKLFHDQKITYPLKNPKISTSSFLLEVLNKNEKNILKDEDLQKKIQSIPIKKIIEHEKTSKEEQMEEEKNEEADDAEVEKEVEKNSLIFSGLVFFISRECPFSHCEFIIKCKGGRIELNEESESITHHILDRPRIPERIENFKREFIQPQWLFDCVNVGIALPVEKYKAGCKLPPHLSPFVDYEKNPYVPDYAKELATLKNKNLVDIREEGNVDPKKKEELERMKEEKQYQEELNKELKEKKEGDDEENIEEEKIEDEERKLKETMMSRKKYKLYSRKRKSDQRKVERVEALKKRKLEKKNK